MNDNLKIMMSGADFAAAENHHPVYQAAYLDEPCLKQEFLDLVGGDEGLARRLFEACDWQRPSTVLNDMGGIEALVKSSKKDEVSVVHGRYPTGKKSHGLFVAIYGDGDYPLYKDNNQNLMALSTLVGHEAAMRIRNDEGERMGSDYPDNYRKLKISANVLHSSIYAQNSIRLEAINIEKDVTPDASPVASPVASPDASPDAFPVASPSDSSAAHQPQKSESNEEAIARYAKLLSKFMPPGQLKVIINNIRGEEGEFFVKMLEGLHRDISAMPATYDQEGAGDEAIAHLHYFHGGANWYITERDIGESGNKAEPIGDQYQAFGLADLFGDGGEIGYISIEELRQNGVELDLYWEPKSLRSIRSPGESPAL